MRDRNIIISAVVLILAMGLISMGFNQSTAYVVKENRYDMKVGGVLDINGKMLKLENVGGGGNIVANVDGVSETITKYDAANVNGLGVQILRTDYQAEKARRTARLRIVRLDDDEYFLNPGKKVYLGSAEIMLKLENVGNTGSAVVNVDGVVVTVGLGKTKEVNGIEITNKNAFYESIIIKRSAVIKAKLIFG